MPTISRSIAVFKKNGVDPWYAQAILLIESPGKMNTKSGVGANGPFQLMKAVAKKEGLVVNKTIDERTDIEKSALGASRLLSKICIPYTKAMLDSAHVPYNETDLWFRLLVLHSYHAGAGNVAGIIRKIKPCEGGMQLIQTVWQTTYGGFKNASQNYSQLALAAFCNFDQLVMQKNDSVYLIDGDRMLNAYVSCKCAPYDECSYLGNCINKYESDLLDGTIPFDYFITKVKAVETELGGLTPYKFPNGDERFNDIGFQLLKARKTEDAYKLFKHNEEEYPDSWSVYHGLGETYRLMGKKDLALTNYRKSLKLNPNNEESQRAIAKLTGK
jgi:tetratricopeptide (TPR) repeat protein